MALTDKQKERYYRHFLLDGVDDAAYERLLSARVLVVGVGGLGSAICYYLAAAGVGYLGIMDDDILEESNLQRQILFTTDDIGEKKVVSAAKRLGQLNQDTQVTAIDDMLTLDNVSRYVSEYDYIIAATDTFFSKFLLNDVCVMQKKPYSYGGATRLFGLTMTVVPPESACYRCAIPSAPFQDMSPGGTQFGVLGPMPGAIGSMQAQDCIKYFLQIGRLFTNRVMYMDSLNGTMQTRRIEKTPQCPVCGDDPIIRSLDNYEETIKQILPTEPPEDRP